MGGTGIGEFCWVDGLYFISTASFQLHKAADCGFGYEAIPDRSQQVPPEGQALAALPVAAKGNMRNSDGALH